MEINEIEGLIANRRPGAEADVLLISLIDILRSLRETNADYEDFHLICEIIQEFSRDNFQEAIKELLNKWG